VIFAAPPIAHASVNDIDAINAVLTHPGVYGPERAIVDVEDRLIVTVPGIVVGFRTVRDRVHECHLAAVPDKRGRETVQTLRRIRDWWWESQPSDLLIGAIPDTARGARYVITATGFGRWKEINCPDARGMPQNHVIYRMERPQ